MELTDNIVKLTATSYLYFSPKWLDSSAVSEYHITTTTNIVGDPGLGVHIWEVLKLNYGGTNQIWMWYEEFILFFNRINIEEINQ